MPPAAERTWTVDVENYSIVADKGPFLHLELDDKADADSLSFHTFRLFSFKDGYAIPAVVKGRYLVNTHEDDDPDNPLSSSDLTLPALIEPAETGQPSVIGLYWKVKSNGRIYAQTLPTDLKVAADRSTQDETWLTDESSTPMKLELIGALKPLPAEDGNNILKRFDEWIKNHSEYFRARAIRNHSACRAWLNHGSYLSHFTMIMTLAQQSTRAEVMLAHGLGKGGAAKGKGAAAAAPDSAAKAEMEEKWAGFLQAVEPFRLSVVAASAPVGHRLIQVDLPYCIDDPDFDKSKFLKLIQDTGLKDKSQEICDLLMGAPALAYLRNQEADHLLPVSPYPVVRAEVDAPAPAPASSNPRNEKRGRNEVDPKQGAAPKEPRVRAAPQRLDAASPIRKAASPPKRKKADRSTPASAPEVTPAAPEKTTRKYVRSGKYSKDPAKAALASAKKKSPPKGTDPTVPQPAVEGNTVDTGSQNSNSNSNFDCEFEFARPCAR